MRSALRLPPIRVMTVDDHQIFREGVGAMVRSQQDMLLAAEAANGQQAVDLFRKYLPDITLMDLRLPDINGVEALTQIRQICPEARVVVLTTCKGDVQVLRALKAGAYSYLLKGMPPEYMLETIRSVHGGRKRIPPEIAAELAEYAASDNLTDRETEVLRHVAEGRSNMMIAHRLHITRDTVKAHMKSIICKLGANDRTHAVVIGLRRGFLDLPG